MKNANEYGNQENREDALVPGRSKAFQQQSDNTDREWAIVSSEELQCSIAETLPFLRIGRSSILLFMQTLNSTLRLKRGKFLPYNTVQESGPKPSAFIPEAGELTARYKKIVNGIPMVSFAETLFGNPTTAHILGGAVMGADHDSGVINADNEVFGYKNMLVCDGSMISSNPGVNPSLSITAITERAMSNIPPKE